MRIGFVATRLAGTDGVSLEAEKWASFFESQGHRCFYFAGELDRPQEQSIIVDEAHFQHPEILEIYRGCFGRQTREADISRQIHRLREMLKEHLRHFIDHFDLDLLIAENALSLPLNLPLGMALAEVIAETGIPTIGHHHDFYWERQRMLVSGAWDCLNMAFPAHLPQVRHVVINSSAAHQVSLRVGVATEVIPNVLDFEHPPEPPDEYAQDVREAFRLKPDETFFLQPTRVVARKGIEHAVELVHRLDRPGKLVISHAAGDEEQGYEKRVRTYSSFMDVQTLFVSERISDHRGQTSDGRKIYALADVYPHADLVTYPSLTEGFGNAFLETIYYRLPIVVNSYSVYKIDIKPKGFRAVEINNYVTDETVEQARRVLDEPDLREEMVETNYQLALKNYSYSVLERKLQSLLIDALGR